MGRAGAQCHRPRLLATDRRLRRGRVQRVAYTAPQQLGHDAQILLTHISGQGAQRRDVVTHETIALRVGERVACTCRDGFWAGFYLRKGSVGGREHRIRDGPATTLDGRLARHPSARLHPELPAGSRWMHSARCGPAASTRPSGAGSIDAISRCTATRRGLRRLHTASPLLVRVEALIHRHQLGQRLLLELGTRLTTRKCKRRDHALARIADAWRIAQLQANLLELLQNLLYVRCARITQLTVKPSETPARAPPAPPR